VDLPKKPVRRGQKGRQEKPKNKIKATRRRVFEEVQPRTDVLLGTEADLRQPQRTSPLEAERRQSESQKEWALQRLQDGGVDQTVYNNCRWGTGTGTCLVVAQQNCNWHKYDPITMDGGNWGFNKNVD